MSSPQLPPAWQNEAFDQALDTAGLACPLPLLKTKLALSQMLSGQVLRVVATDAGSWRDIQAFAERAGLTDGQWSVGFQSRLGRAKWIEPYTEERLDELAAAGVKRLLVMCPAFVADCIETLEEIGDRGREQFIAAGGEELVLVPCLNTHPRWVEALASLCQKVPQALA